MFVIKRNGKQERVHFDKITSRITKLAYGLNMNFVDPGAIYLLLRSPVHHHESDSKLAALASAASGREKRFCSSSNFPPCCPSNLRLVCATFL
jgi:hypothetical protein